MTGNCGISMTTTHKDAYHDLNMSQGCILWVSRILTIEILAMRVGCSQGNLLSKLIEVTRLT
jgi:hypothetical protein